ncbi:pentatricopeptide repeat-containing protein At2g20710, mitochondrial isoform X2 [Glycine max]|uniref:pentatricopeptide repeat-containing protein At2g20710, mitochondrial isoform X2 n=1 Tax=Glycine max TaxID=3847 RepID=UPI000719129F|nr:pentatricopeptide repeat-containing protein At2g20710, mitochondrial isoform X2 [Glycine max]|eukprot:XP_014620539.1 pentatricopeptide repeat-containing protein At2g20710, mitochondrial isoform X2 [Glycine max]
MMMLIRSKCKLVKMCGVCVCGSLEMCMYSTESVVASLENRVFKVGDPVIPVSPILKQWVEEGREVTKLQLENLVYRLTQSRRFTHALQVLEWMSNERNYELSPGNIAKQINLISKVRGLEQAEKYFRGIPDAKIEFKIYAALLRCYAEHKSVEEAEAVLKKIKELHPVNITACCNMMLELYAKKGKYEKLDRLMQEMKEKDICNAGTYTIRLNAYVIATDIKGMEKLLMQMEVDPMATVDWYTYMTAANGYRKVHNFEKVAAMLKKSEHVARGKTKRLAYESIQTMYAIIGNKDEVHRLWNMCTSPKKPNKSYIRMLSSLVKLDDIDGAEKILEEWESVHENFDVRIPNLMISAYCKWGQFDKAEAYIRRLLDGGKHLDGRTWDRLACGYNAGNDMENAVQAMKKAVSTNLAGRRPDPFTLVACVKYLKEKGDLDLALEILKLCIENSHISVTSYDGLVSYVHNEIPDTEPLDLIKGDYQMDENKKVATTAYL